MRRQPAEKAEGILAATFREAMALAERMRANGESAESIQDAIATALKAAWPKGRDEPWHYACDDCADSGWRLLTCQQRSCGRPFKLPKQIGDDHTGRGTCTDGHTFAEPCWCARGRQLRAGLLKEQRQEDDAIAVAARTSKPTRVGR